MLGAIIAFITGGSIIKSEIKGWSKDADSKAKASVKDPFGTYYDHNGKQRWIKDGQLCTVRSNNEGDLCVIAVPSGKVLRNISEEKRQSKLKSYVEKYDEYHTVINVTPKRTKTPGLTELDEPIYQDLKTGQKFVVREFGKKYNHWHKKVEPDYVVSKLFNKKEADKLNKLIFYMDIETGFLVRVSDSFKRQYREKEERANRKQSDEGAQNSWKYAKYDYSQSDVFISKFNEYQKKQRPEMDLKNDTLDFLEYYCVNYKYVGNEEDKNRE